MKALLDGDVLAYSVGHSVKGHSEDYALRALDSRLIDITQLYMGCSSMEGFLSHSGPHYRHKVAVTQPYKGNRVGVVKPQHHQALRNHMEKVHKFVMSEDAEADDYLGIRSQELGPKACVVGSVDKDLLTLPGVHYNFTTHKFTKVNSAEASCNFYRQVLTGDKVDNIRGCWLPGDEHKFQVGKVRAAKLITPALSDLEMFQVCLEAYRGDRDRMMESCNLLWIQREPKGYFVAPDLNTKGQLHGVL